MTTSRQTTAASLQRTSIARRMTAQAVILTGFVIVSLTTLSFFIARLMLERVVFAQLSSVASISENALESTLQTHRERASLLTGSAEIQSLLAGQSAPALLTSLMGELQTWQQTLMGMELYDAEGSRIAAGGVAVGSPDSMHTASARPVVTVDGWMYYDVFVPVRADGVTQGMLAMRYDAHTALEPLLSVVPSLGTSAQAVLVYRNGQNVHIIHPSVDPHDAYLLTMEGSFTGLEESPLFLAMDGKENVTRDMDYKGIDSIIAYRYLPLLGWGLLVQVEQADAFRDVRRLAVAHGAIGMLLLILAWALARALAMQITLPLRSLTQRVGDLKPGNWIIDRSVHSGDEVAVLETVVADMADRLHGVYEHQEEIIDVRTSELRQQSALDHAILENIGYGVVTVDSGGLITGANPSALTMLATTEDALHQKEFATVVPVCGHQGNPLPDEQPITQCLRTRTVQRSPVNAHFNIRRSDETLFPVMYTVSPLQSGESVFGAVFVFQDVTEERRLDYLKSEFITLASHQLRTPLSAIRWYVELLGEDAEHLSGEQRDYLHEMEVSTVRMAALLTSLLHAARLEGDSLEPEIQEVDALKLMQELHDDCVAMAHESGLSCTLQSPDTPVTIETDPTLLRVVLQNLITNAMKYSKNIKGAVALALAEDADHVIISVRDQGMGIPVDEQSRVFQKFFRAKNVRKMDTDGNGLGLYITKTIVERLGGIITFQSEENKGSVFTITLPKKAEAARR